MSLQEFLLAHPAWEGVVVFCAQTLPYIVLGLALVFFVIHRHYVKNETVSLRSIFAKVYEFLFFGLSAVLAWLSAAILKKIIGAPRPIERLHDLVPAIIEYGFNSFPSGHATFFSALATMLYLRHKGVGVLFFFFALVIGIARVVAGVHFPIDILAGYALGVGVTLIINHFIFKHKKVGF